MKHVFSKTLLLSALTAVSINASADAEVDLDDITMDIVTDGSIEANRLARPDMQAIMQYRANAEGSIPDAETRAEFWQQRAENLPEDAPQATEEMIEQFEALHEALAAGDTESAAEIRADIESQMSELGLQRPEGVGGRPDGLGQGRPAGLGERPEGAPDFAGSRPDFAGERPDDAPTPDEIREILESGDEDAIAELRELWADRKNRGWGRPSQD